MSRLPLRLRLPILTTALLIVALAVSATLSVTLLERSLIREVDDQLRGAAQQFMQQGVRGLSGGDDDGLRPSNYYLQVVDADGSPALSMLATTLMAEPDLPALDAASVQEIAGEYQTVGSVDGGPRWRFVAYPATEQGNVVGAVVLALPMSSVEATLSDMRRLVLLVSLTVVVVAAVIGYAAVQRELRGLRGIEHTAAAVAGGNLSQRVPPAPVSTEVGRLGASFNHMVAALERAFAERAASEARTKRFISDASHELRTPLASIRGYGELYRMGAVDGEEVPATMNRIESEARRMGALVEDLLVLARLDEGQPLTWGRVDLRDIAGDAAADLGALDPTRQVDLDAPEALIIDADADRLRQVLTNLIGNVARHTPAGTPVQLSVRGDGGEAIVQVVDHGPGIAADDAQRVFERFYRPDTSRARNSGGTGLGLAIVATIVAAHGGTVRYSPTPGGGTTIVVRLPRSRLVPGSPPVTQRPTAGDGPPGGLGPTGPGTGEAQRPGRTGGQSD